MRDLRKGDEGPDVREWQYTLCRLDYVVVCDGNFGSATDAATRDLQKRAGLVVDGVVAGVVDTRKRSCNLHNNCDAANRRAREQGYLSAAHCSDPCCEDCFGN